MRESRRVDVVGAGRLGRVLCEWLRSSGWTLDTIVGRQAARAKRAARVLRARRGAGLAAYCGQANVVVIATPDDALPGVARRLARGATDWDGKVVLHSSGLLGAEVLAPLRRRGAAVGSLHPLMTFAPGASPSPAGVVFAIEGDRAACRLARHIVAGWRGRALALREEQKAAYHLAAMFASPMVVVSFALAVDCLRGAGLSPAQVRTAAAGLQRLLAQTAANLAPGDAHAIKAAWTGPIARGDRQTVSRHLAVAGPAAGAYRALAARAAQLLPAGRVESGE